MNIVIAIIVAVVIVLLALVGVFVWRICVGRKNTKRLQNQMQIKKQQFASQHGLNLFEINNTVATIHI